jgi:hypothetical protein
MDELSEATEGLAMDVVESASGSGAAESTPPTTSATDIGVDDKGEQKRPNSNRRIAEQARGNESTPYRTRIPA